jgi:glycolate oxidase
VLSVERLNRILEIDELNLLAVVEPAVITADLQRAVEKVGLFYPPDPASLEKSSIGGNVAECAGGPRGFKYGTTKRYVLALQAVLPTGEIIETGSKAVKNVVGYDLTQLIVGSEGTLAVVTKVTLRLIPKPPAQATLLAMFADIQERWMPLPRSSTVASVPPRSSSLMPMPWTPSGITRKRRSRLRDGRSHHHGSRWLSGSG